MELIMHCDTFRHKTFCNYHSWYKYYGMVVRHCQLVRIILITIQLLQADWFGNSMYDLVHPDDVEKVREQLSTTESQNTGRILDLKSRFLV